MNKHIGQINKSLTRRTLGATLWSSSGTGAQAASNILVTIILARLLTPGDFGLIGAAMVVVAFCQIIAQLGVGPAIVQRASLTAKHLESGFTLSVLLGLLLAGIIALLAPAVSMFFRMEALTLVLRVLAPVFVLRSLSTVAESLLQRELRFRTLAVTQVTSYVLGYGLVGVVLAWWGYGVWALVGAQLTQTALETPIILLIQPHPKRLSLDAQAVKELVYMGGGFTMARVANYFSLQGDNLVVGRWLGANALGLYTRAYRLMSWPANLFGDAAGKVLFSSMARVQNEPQRLATGYRRGVALTTLLALPASVSAFILAPEIVLVVLGPKWSGAVPALQFLALGMFFRLGYKVSNIVIQAKGSVNRLAFYKLLHAIFIVTSALIGQLYGITGVALGVTVALALHYLLLAQLCIKIIQMNWRDFLSTHVPAVTLTTVCFIVSWLVVNLLREINLPAMVVLFTTLTIILFCISLLVRIAPRLFLGKDGVWWVQIFSKYILLPYAKFARQS